MFKELALIIGIPIGGIFALIFGLVFLICPASCHGHWNGSGFDSRWSLFGDCQINVHGRWLPEDSWKQIQAEISK